MLSKKVISTKMYYVQWVVFGLIMLYSYLPIINYGYSVYFSKK